MSGAFSGRNTAIEFQVVSAACKLITEDGTMYAAIIHEALFDDNPTQVESLLSVHQVLQLRYNAIDDRAKCENDIDGNPGTQSAKFDKFRLAFFFDGVKCFFMVQSISNDELQTLPKVVLTAGSKPYDPLVRLAIRRRTNNKHSSYELLRWKAQLGFIPDHVVKKTLTSTTQLVPTVEAETREVMRDHFQSRFPQLKFRRVNDTCYADTFFSSITSVRGYKCFNLYAFKKSGLDKVYLLRSRSQGISTLSDLVTDCGIPAIIKTDNAPEFKANKWVAFLRQHFIQQEFTEPHHPNQNLAERRGGIIKAATVHLLFVTKAPLQYWCFALEYVAEIRTCIAKRSLQWKTPKEMHWGDTPDISVFRFVFFQPIWYYDPRPSFPNPRMYKGRFLGIAPTTGDHFCFRVLTVPPPGEAPQVLARSNIRSRTCTSPETELPLDDTNDPIEFRTRNNTILEDVSLDEDSEEARYLDMPQDSMDTDRLVTEILDPFPDGSNSDDPFLNGYLEVYGPERAIPTVLHDDTALVATNSEELSIGMGETTTPPMENTAMTSDQNTEMVSPDLQDLSDRTLLNNTMMESPTIYESPVIQEITNTDDHCDDVHHVDVPIVSPEIEESAEIQDEVAVQMENIVHQPLENMDFDLDQITAHTWTDGVLQFSVLWKTGDTTNVDYTVLKRDYPLATAQYILSSKIGAVDGRYVSGSYARWARSFLRQLNKCLRRCIRMKFQWSTVNDHIDTETTIQFPEQNMHGTGVIRRVATNDNARLSNKKRRKPGRIARPLKEKYGVLIPTTVEEALALDKLNNNTYWQDAIFTEVKTLIDLGCFEFLSPQDKPSSEYQLTKLTMIFEVKQDGRRKARLVAGGHLVELQGLNARSTVVKGISLRLLDIIAHRDNLQILCGDVTNAFITADCLEKVYAYCGPEFQDRQGCRVIFKKALYGLKSSGRAFRAHFADYLRALGFTAVRYDRDVWIRLRDDESGYDYICTHVDDFKIVAKDPQRWMDMIQIKFKLKSVGPPSYYLGNNYHWSEQHQSWTISCSTYVNECIRKIEADEYFGGTLIKHKTPIPDKIHPEMDESELLDEMGIKKYQQLIGMAQWALTIGRLDISYALSSLSRFNTNPRYNHLVLALHMFGYLKKFPNRRLVVDSKPLSLSEEYSKTSFHPDFLEDYEDATEDIPNKMPTPKGTELQTSVFFDADHAHDQRTRRSVSGIFVFVGSTPVIWSSKRQGCIATSTYTAEFISMRTAVEEAIAIRYYLRCLGVPVSTPTNIFGDNFSVIQSSTLAHGELKKKHIAISYHYVREAIAAKIINAIWIATEDNFADVNTKPLGKIKFNAFIEALMD